MKRFFSVSLLIIFIIVLPVYFIANNLWQLASQENFITGALDRSGIYQQATGLAVANLIPAEQLAELEKTGVISQKELEDMVNQLLPPDYLQTVIEDSLAEGYGLLNSEKNIEDLSLQIDLTNIKQQAPELFTAKVEEKFFQLPVCSQQELEDLEEQLSEGFNFPSCRPAEASSEELTGEIEKPIREITANFPDQLDVAKLITGEQKINIGDEDEQADEGEAEPAEKEPVNLAEINQNLEQIREVMAQVNFWLTFTFFSLILILLLIIFLNLRPIKSLLRWTGTSLLIPGVIILLATLSFTFYPVNQISEEIGRGDLPEEVGEIVVGIFQDLAKELISPLRTQALIIFLVGLILLVSSFFFKQDKKVPERKKKPAN